MMLLLLTGCGAGALTPSASVKPTPARSTASSTAKPTVLAPTTTSPSSSTAASLGPLAATGFGSITLAGAVSAHFTGQLMVPNSSAGCFTGAPNPPGVTSAQWFGTAGTASLSVTVYFHGTATSSQLPSTSGSATPSAGIEITENNTTWVSQSGSMTLAIGARSGWISATATAPGVRSMTVDASWNC